MIRWLQRFIGEEFLIRDSRSSFTQPRKPLRGTVFALATPGTPTDTALGHGERPMFGPVVKNYIGEESNLGLDVGYTLYSHCTTDVDICIGFTIAIISSRRLREGTVRSD